MVVSYLCSKEKWLTHSTSHNRFHLKNKDNPFRKQTDTHMGYIVDKADPSRPKFFSYMNDYQKISMYTSGAELYLSYVRILIFFLYEYPKQNYFFKGVIRS